jgi:hypothetical protein
MYRLSRWLFVGAFGFALVVGALALRPSDACATTGGCLIPSVAVSTYLDTIGSSIRSDLSSDLARCRNQCVEVKEGCAGVCDAAERCTLRAVDSELDADRLGCRDLSGAARQSCEQSAKSSWEGFKSFVNSDKSSAQQTCAANVNSCFSQCED